jgi:hypothetical protein
VDWPIHDDPENKQRYFAVIADCDVLADIVAGAPRRTVSLSRFFPVWFGKPSADRDTG